MEEKIKDLIEKAKKIAKDNYELPLIKKGLLCDSPREWKENKRNGKISYVLEGSPDKAFVLFAPKQRIIIAFDGSGKKLKEFNY